MYNICIYHITYYRYLLHDDHLIYDRVTILRRSSYLEINSFNPIITTVVGDG